MVEGVVCWVWRVALRAYPESLVVVDESDLNICFRDLALVTGLGLRV